MKNNKQVEELGKLMNEQMKSIALGNKGITVELGKIGANMSLSTDSLSNAIPRGEYMISLHLRNVPMIIDSSEVELITENESLSTEDAEGHSHGIQEHAHEIKAHLHTVEIPSKLRGIQPGDRVIVAWVGTEPVVVDIVVSS